MCNRTLQSPTHAPIAKLALEDGTVFTGTSFGAEGEVDGEVCFNTSMTGYQEILTDPSYRGQIVTMTYPQIGNYGVNAKTWKAGSRIWPVSWCGSRAAGSSNFRAEERLEDYLHPLRHCRPWKGSTRGPWSAACASEGP